MGTAVSSLEEAVMDKENGICPDNLCLTKSTINTERI